MNYRMLLHKVVSNEVGHPSRFQSDELPAALVDR